MPLPTSATTSFKLIIIGGAETDTSSLSRILLCCLMTLFSSLIVSNAWSVDFSALAKICWVKKPNNIMSECWKYHNSGSFIERLVSLGSQKYLIESNTPPPLPHPKTSLVRTPTSSLAKVRKYSIQAATPWKQYLLRCTYLLLGIDEEDKITISLNFLSMRSVHPRLAATEWDSYEWFFSEQSTLKTPLRSLKYKERHRNRQMVQA